MYLASLTDETREMYCLWFDGLGIPRPPRAEEMVLVRDESDLLGGVCLYVTDGPYMFMEHFALNPDVGGKEALKVSDFICRAATAYGTIRGKQVIALVRVQELANILQTRGYAPTDHAVMLAPVGLEPARVTPEVDEQLAPEPKVVDLATVKMPEPEDLGGDEGGGIMAAAKARSRPKTRRKRAKKTEEG